ncbi:hypothetical protein [Helicobacter sp. 11S02596-1]|uniref:hypothetical protein n=1 Tax=Helicobacter sp. 11S02596-1 TaxID=1476194 RepID=UPI000BA5001F|nr:hypothetical protein [Helicobacter sp. 11S02596-1]PAF42811.1 hypothetical protein BJI48_06025 [Helicobacter sp. 11S02596-1]
MPKLDEKKAKLEELKTYRNFALTSLLTLIAFIFTRITESNALDTRFKCFNDCSAWIKRFYATKEDIKNNQRDRRAVMEILAICAAVFGLISFFATIALVIRSV